MCEVIFELSAGVFQLNMGICAKMLQSLNKADCVRFQIGEQSGREQ
jgi:hypothetical protein